VTGAEILNVRLKLDLSQEAFGRLIGFSASKSGETIRGRVSRWERNAAPIPPLVAEKVRSLAAKAEAA